MSPGVFWRMIQDWILRFICFSYRQEVKTTEVHLFLQIQKTSGGHHEARQLHGFRFECRLLNDNN